MARDLKPYNGLLVAIALTATGMMVAFGTVRGSIPVGHGIIITLLTIGLITLVNIHIRAEELTERVR